MRLDGEKQNLESENKTNVIQSSFIYFMSSHLILNFTVISLMQFIHAHKGI